MIGCVSKSFFHPQEKLEQLEEKLEMRRKQFHVLISSVHSLQGMLDEEEMNDKGKACGQIYKFFEDS